MKNMEFFMLELFLVIFFCFLGVLTGILTGLLPGLHVNNIALILLSLTGFFLSSFSFLFEYGISSEFIFMLIGVFILSCALSHSFHDTIPSTFLGAPDPDTALSVLPAHDLLLKGHGFEAVSLSALGSFGAVVFCFLLLLPIRFIIGSPLFFYDVLKDIMVFVLVAISILMICTEKSKIDLFNKGGIFPSVLGMLFALFVFLLSGFFGFVIFELYVDSPIGLESPVLFPSLAGLFGMPTLVTSLMTKPVIPEQDLSEPVLDVKAKKASILSVVTGSLGGILVSIIPGITSATGTVISMNARGESDKKQTIVTLSAVNTACAFFVVVMMFVILKSRSGAALAVMSIISVDEWSGFLIPEFLCYFLISLLLGGVFSYFLTLKIGKIFARKFANVPYALLVKSTITLIGALVFLFTGFMGLLILLISTFIGLLPVEFGVRRSHCMGVLLIPIIFYFI
jgi:putative membrane protein